MHQIAVRCRHVAIHAPARFCAHACDLVSACLNLFDSIVQADSTAKPFEMRHHSRDEAVGSALSKPDAAFFFDGVNERINCAGVHRVAADQQGMERQCLT